MNRKPLHQSKQRNPDTPLSARQLGFVVAYSQHGNGTRAAIESGYSERSAAALASQLLSNVKIKRAVADMAAKSMDATIANNTERRQFWTQVMRADAIPDSLLSMATMTERLRASELLGKTAGDFLERIEHSGQLVTLNLNLAGPKK